MHRASHRDNFSPRSPRLSVQDIGEVHVRFNTKDGVEKLARLDVALSGPVVFVSLHWEERGWPICIENASDYEFAVSQAVSAP